MKRANLEGGPATLKTAGQQRSPLLLTGLISQHPADPQELVSTALYQRSVVHPFASASPETKTLSVRQFGCPHLSVPHLAVMVWNLRFLHINFMVVLWKTKRKKIHQPKSGLK